MARRKLKHRSFDLYSAYSYYFPDLKGVLMLLVMFLFGALLGNIVTYGMMVCFKSFSTSIVNGAAMLVAYPIMFIPPMLYASYKSRMNEGFDNIGLKVDSSNFGYFSTFSIILAVITATVAMAFVMDIFGAILPPMPEFLKNAMNAFDDNPVWMTLLSVCVFAPFFEEWLCRGMVLRGLLQHMKPIWAIVVSALFFALIHANPWQAIPAFLGGMLFGYVYYKTGSVKLTMLMHCINNLISTICGRIDVLKDCTSFMDVMSTSTYVIMFLVCLLWVVYFILRITRIGIPLGRHGNFDPVGLPVDEDLSSDPAGTPSSPAE